MTDTASHDFTEVVIPTALNSRIAALRNAFASYRRTRAIYRQQRAIYFQTLRELQSYRPSEMHDLRIDPADFEAVARKQAGW